MKDTQEITFDPSGRMWSFPKIYVTDKTMPDFRVKATDKQIKAQIGKMAVHLDSVKALLQNNNVKNAYNCFFKTNEDYPKLVAGIDNMIALLKKGPDCQPEGWEKLIGEVSKLNLEKIVPLVSYLKNIKEQYKVEVYKGGLLVEEIPLLLLNNSCEQGCYQFSSAQLRQLRNIQGVNCLSDPWSELHFKLVQDDPWNKTIREWYKGEVSLLFAKKVDFIMGGLKKAASANLTTNADDFKDGIRALTNLQDWLIHWFWLTKGRLALNPFNQLAEVQRKKLSNELKDWELQLTQAKQKAMFLDSARTKTDEKLSELSHFELVQLKEQQLAEQIKVIENKLKKVKGELDDDANLTKLKTLNILYEGKFKLSERFKNIDGQYPQKQFDASRDYQGIKYHFLQKVKVKEIPEGHILHVLAHNVPGSQGVKIEERASPFKDEEMFTSLVNEQLSSFDFTTIPAGAVEQLQSFSASFFTKQLPGPKGAGGQDNICGAIQPFLKELAKSLWQKDGQEIFPLDKDIFNGIAYSDPKYKTHMLQTSIESGEAVIDSIFLKRYTSKDTLKTTTMAKTSVKIGEMRYFMLAAGIAIHKSPLAVTSVDTTGGTLRTSTSETRSRAIIGFKFYPFKNYNRDHSILPRFPLRRLSIFFGAEMLKPLQNLYLGGSYDIVPGLNVSVGQNYALQTRYRIQSNRVTDTSRSYARTGLYYSASINPVLFVQFVKLFFK
ncbi:DUF342 domain-containing protein [Dyadobacter jiangsuensis]|nr:DUF342 domain-containing protein [Dyadobacter jiangsuensis]